jgi:ketoreductase RED2
VQGDIARPEDVKKIVDAAVDRWGHIDLLVNNAGMTVRVPHYDLAGATLEVWQEIFGVNLFGTWMMCQVALPRLAEGDGGCIVNMGSLAGLLCAGSSIPYAVSKAAVIHLTRLLARVAGPEVRINAIAPGFIETPWTVARPEVRDAAVASAPLAAAGSVQDIADGVCWLADSRYITGETITIDGGVNLVHAVSPVPAPPF